MSDAQHPADDLLHTLNERAKELNCLFGVEEILNEPDIEPIDACRRIVELLPPGWQYTDICEARIRLGDDIVTTPDFVETQWRQKAWIKAQDQVTGVLEVFYTQPMPVEDEGPFLKEETRLIRTIADRIGHYVHHHRMRRHIEAVEAAKRDLHDEAPDGDWRVVHDLLRRTDRDLLQKISQKLLHYLCWQGISEAEELLEESDIRQFAEEDLTDTNRPQQTKRRVISDDLGLKTFRIASRNMANDQLLTLVQKWVQQDRISFLAGAVERNVPLAEIADALRRYVHLAAHEEPLTQPASAHIRVALVRRFLSEQLTFIRFAKEFLEIQDFESILPRVIAPPESHGRLGGKSAGIILAKKILEKERDRNPEIGEVRAPRTWFITSDMHVHFMHYNNLDEVAEQKYKSTSEIRFEYPHIVHSCKNSRFPNHLVSGLALALDDFGESPLIVRSSSVLEDRIGAAFSGKYKSLFVGNQGSKQERIEALLDAIAEIYACMFAPDPIQYRAERGLLDFAEEMGIIIQEVVGNQVGKYFFPAFAGVALSRNEFRWSPRIKREDGIVRMVPGLGTRAVDRVGDDYPVMFAPGQPDLRVNVTPDEILRYSPRFIDAIDVESNTFVTLKVRDLVEEFGDELPAFVRLFSLYEDGRMRRPGPLESDISPDDAVLTFEGQLADRKFAKQIRTILDVLEEKMQGPVDIEFAHDGTTLHLLQCRSQSDAEEAQPAPIPKDVDPSRVIFSANRYVSNGYVPDISHIVYVDPEKYVALGSRAELLDVARVVGDLNKILPKRQFILMGPGRWGSRGDIKLGVSVTYADINNSAALIEIARTTGNYTPDLSFGTHFFQDLVEAQIRYLPLYPDDEGVQFSENFLRGKENILREILPDHAHLSDTVRVIDVPGVTDGLVMKLLMNADLDEALGLIGEPGREVGLPTTVIRRAGGKAPDHSLWRLRMAERIARSIDATRYGVTAIYVFGSTKNFTAGPASDIDLLVHVEEDRPAGSELTNWFRGWSEALDEMNYQRTGYRTNGLLDVHLITDADIEARTSYAVKIGAVTDAARKLELDPDPQ
ncbi:MAG: PEP/pyruvate-binding domain-containing protein [Planctomycetota bacterium]